MHLSLLIAQLVVVLVARVLRHLLNVLTEEIRSWLTSIVKNLMFLVNVNLLLGGWLECLSFLRGVIKNIRKAVLK